MNRRGLVVAALLGAASSTAFGIGADVAYQDSTAYANYGNVGGIRAYYLASWTCNLGDTTLAWQNQGTPVLFVEMFRLHGGRLEQIGLGWGKYACCAASGSGCPSTCNTGSPGTGLKAGCRDSYGAGYNGTQSRLGPRSGVNAWTGSVGPVPGGTNTDITRRLQVQQSDVTLTNFPGAKFFVQGTYVATDDAVALNHYNNSSYKPVNVNQTNFNLETNTNPGMGMQLGRPAIYAWRDHGLGDNVVDPSVTVVTADVPSEGRFLAASKVTPLGGGLYRYDYAVQNLNSDRSGASFTVPVPAGVVVTNMGFHDIDYHSGEPYASNEWSSGRLESSVKWATLDKFNSNPNGNALRFGTMYNFWFTANVAPAGSSSDCTITLFKPHTPSSIPVVGLQVPGGLACPADVDSDGVFGNGLTPDGGTDINDLLSFLAGFEAGSIDLDDDGVGTIGNPDGGTDINDLLFFLNHFEAGC